jgi:hypothetical protein
MPYGPPPPAKRNGLKIGLIIGAVVLVLLCLCGVLVVVGLSRLADTNPSGVGAPAPRPNLSTEAEETEDPGSGREFGQGDCVVNEGTQSNAELRKVPCAPGVYQVLLKIPFSVDGDDCKLLAPDADADYVHDSPLDSSDYVLCLKKQ